MTTRLPYNTAFCEVANEGLSWCRGGNGCHMRHDLEGSVNRDGIHLTDRPVTKGNTVTFLRLVARANDPSIDEDPMLWRRVYRINVAVRELARTLHLRDPAHPARLDRSFVLASVAGMSNEVPMRKQAFDWARRGPKRKEE